MSPHVYHFDLDGYDSRQLFHDGCPECEYLGDDVALALSRMDELTFQRAWKRASDLKGSHGDGLATGRVSYAESDVLNALWGVQVALKRHETNVGFNDEFPLPMLQFSPDAIRRHFKDEDSDLGRFVVSATDDELLEVGRDCLDSDSLKYEFNAVLVDVISDMMQARFDAELEARS